MLAYFSKSNFQLPPTASVCSTTRTYWSGTAGRRRPGGSMTSGSKPPFGSHNDGPMQILPQLAIISPPQPQQWLIIVLPAMDAQKGWLGACLVPCHDADPPSKQKVVRAQPTENILLCSMNASTECFTFTAASRGKRCASTRCTGRPSHSLARRCRCRDASTQGSSPDSQEPSSNSP
ncbi:hypothetical protein E2C01_059921 [Portunus trituberculatus]|uniref:Uncharacterized protein n=1 Tax=Portunus trituberculatus TaxID=210409 RepID=A0A5B7H7X9_PORTR|nr:hypothetical protein [Portunus trituberculatus]